MQAMMQMKPGNLTVSEESTRVSSKKFKLWIFLEECSGEVVITNSIIYTNTHM